jgi:FkbH-like protein
MIVELLKQLIEAQQFEEARRSLYSLAKTVTDYTEFLTLCRWRNRLAAHAPLSLPKTVKVAILGGATTEMLENPLVLALESIGLDCQIHQSEYNTFAHEMLDATSPTAKFRPEVVIVVNTPANLPSWPTPDDNLERVNQLVEEVCNYWLGLCARLREHTQCEIILNNFHLLPTSPLGNLGTKLPWDANNFILRLNIALGDRAPSYVHINDVSGLAAKYGVNQWFDQRYWFYAKQPVSFQCLVPYVNNTARIIGALFGKTAKCLVADLDNTLWGGVIGDDGIEGIVIGEGDAIGEAFKAFQEYLLKLKQRGILLAVCSKNEEANALAPFQEHPEMVLKRKDFVSFKANWQPKPDNLRLIAEELNIGLDSLVFVDDNPAECEHVRQILPQVKIVGLSDDPAEYPQLLDQSGFFEITTLSNEDMQRTEQYQVNIKRKQLYESATDFKTYLASLEQKSVIRPFEERFLDRITQLINKTNQFNLTTLRLSRSQVEERMEDPNVLTAYVRMADRFGDNGLISVFCARREGDELRINQWLMSCRVLKRGVENLLCNYIVEKAREIGATKLNGIYIPTPKNGLVRDHYKSLNFSLVKKDQDGSTYWSLDLDTYKPFEVEIELVEDY